MRRQQKNYPAGIAFMVALVAGPLALFSVLGNDLPATVTISVVVYIIATVAVWYFEDVYNRLP